MKFRYTVFCALSVLMHTAPVCAVKKEHTSVKKVDKNSLAELIKTSKKIVVIDVFATWCSPCKLMAPIFDEVAQSMGTQYDCVKVDLDEVDDFIKRYKVTSVPTILIFKDGKELGRSAGYKDAAALMAKIEEIAQGPKTTKRLPQEALNQRLFEAIQNGDLDELKTAIQAGADVNAQYEEGTTPVVLTIAFTGMHHEKSVQMLKILLDAGASLSFAGPQNPHNESIENIMATMINNTASMLDTFKQMDNVIKCHAAHKSAITKNN